MPRKRKAATAENPLASLNLTGASPLSPGESVKVGERLFQLRSWRGYSIRQLAEMSGLAINTLSLIENEKTSPSVSTLQQIAVALDVPITAFFETESKKQSVVYSSSQQREQNPLDGAAIEDLTMGKFTGTAQSLLVTLPPKSQCGEKHIVHNGHEIIFCLSGRVNYKVDGEPYTLDENDSLIFEANLPHCWKNEQDIPARLLMVLIPAEQRDKSLERHLSNVQTSE